MKLIHKNFIYFFCIFYLVASAEPLLLLSQAETSYMAIPLIRYLAVWLFLFLALLVFMGRVLPSLFALTLSGAFTATIFSLKFVFHSSVSSLSVSLFLAFALVIFCLIFLLIKTLIKLSVFPNRFAYIALVIVGLSAPALNILNDLLQKQVTGNSSDLPISLAERPNIYLLSYDSFIPSSIAKRYIKIDKVPFQEALTTHYQEFTNSLTFHVPSRPSLNNIMRLSQSHQELNFLTFSGNAPSLLSQLLRDNGYSLITGYKGLYFGTAGQFIDKGLFPKLAQIEASVLCIVQKKLERAQGFLVCDLARYLAKNQLNFIYNLIFGSDLGFSDSNWHQKILAQIEENGKSNKPTLSFLYTYNPIGHTSFNYDHDNQHDRIQYREYFIRNSKRLAQQIVDIKHKIDKEDPNSIVLIFGDHGTFLSRSEIFENNPEFFVKDRHRIVIALAKTQNECGKISSLNINDNYNTPSRILLAIFECLSNEEIFDDLNLDFDEDTSIVKYGLD